MAREQTLINLPSPPQDFTPDPAPGTPNSSITSISELSTVAIKDGHRGHIHHQDLSGNRTDGNSSVRFEQERADRISRLAGLERVVHHSISSRPSNGSLNSVSAQAGTPINPSGTLSEGIAVGESAADIVHRSFNLSNLSCSQSAQPTIGYFSSSGEPRLLRGRSTVGSASATASIAGRTSTWASGSEKMYDTDASVTTTTDKNSFTSELFDPERITTASQDGDGGCDCENDTNTNISVDATSTAAESVWDSVDACSDGGSLVGFGEGAQTPAGESTVAAPLPLQQIQQSLRSSALQHNSGQLGGVVTSGGLNGSMVSSSPTDVFIPDHIDLPEQRDRQRSSERELGRDRKHDHEHQHQREKELFENSESGAAVTQISPSTTLTEQRSIAAQQKQLQHQHQNPHQYQHQDGSETITFRQSSFLSNEHPSRSETSQLNVCEWNSRRSRTPTPPSNIIGPASVASRTGLDTPARSHLTTNERATVELQERAQQGRLLGDD